MNMLVVGGFGRHSERLLALQQDDNMVVYVYTMKYKQNAPHEVKRLHDAVESQKSPYIVIQEEDSAASTEQLRRLIQQYNIRVILALLNFSDDSSRIVCQLLEAQINVPIVRAYLEHKCKPNPEERRCMEGAAAHIYQNQESYAYFSSVYDVAGHRHLFWDFNAMPRALVRGEFAPKRRDREGGAHVLIVGSLGADEGRYDYRAFIRELAVRDIHVHVYGRFTAWNIFYSHRDDDDVKQQYVDLSRTFPCVHLYQEIAPEVAVSIWSQYDVGVLHMPSKPLADRYQRFLPDANKFNDMNYPHRYCHCICVGLPVILRENTMRAMRRRLHELDVGIFYKDYDHLATLLCDTDLIRSKTLNALKCRPEMEFERGTPALIQFLRSVAAQ